MGGLIDFYTFFFYHGAQATNEYVIPGMAYLYGRAKDVDTLNKVLQKYSFCLWEMSQDSKEVTKNLQKNKRIQKKILLYTSYCIHSIMSDNNMRS